MLLALWRSAQAPFFSATGQSKGGGGGAGGGDCGAGGGDYGAYDIIFTVLPSLHPSLPSLHPPRATADFLAFSPRSVSWIARVRAFANGAAVDAFTDGASKVSSHLIWASLCVK